MDAETRVDLRNKPAFLDRDGWRHKDVWSRRHSAFTVEVSRHGSQADSNVWCVYIYVFDNHPAFTRFDPDKSMFDNARFECHSYCSYYKAHRDNAGKVTSHQIGWDYNHDGDDLYSHYSTASQASSVFYDASQLFNVAKSWFDEDAALSTIRSTV